MKKWFTQKNRNTDDGQLDAAGGLSLLSLSVLPAAAVAIMIVLVGMYAWWQSSGQIAEQHKAAQQAEAQRVAAYLSARALSLTEEVERLAKSDDVLLEAVATQDRFALQVLARRMQEHFPQALQIHYILPVDIQPATGSGLLPGYASLDLARQAEAGRKPPLELHRANTEQVHLALLRPVQYQGETIASLLLMLPSDWLSQWMAEQRIGSGVLQLRQGDLDVLSQRQVVASGDDISVPIRHTAWQLVYRPNQGSTTPGLFGHLTLYLIIAALAAVLLMAFAGYLARMVRADMGSMVTYIIDSSMGKRFHSYPVKLAETKQVLGEKENGLSLLVASASVVAGMGHSEDEHDFHDLIFSDEEMFVVEEEELAEEQQGEPSYRKA